MAPACFNARSTLRTLLALNVIPIINENDTVTTDEIRFGDNDTLGALVTNLIEADALDQLGDGELLRLRLQRLHQRVERPDRLERRGADAGLVRAAERFPQ